MDGNIQFEMTLHFFIDKEHFPYEYQGDLSFTNSKLVELLGSANTWLLWTLRTYLELKQQYDCTLTDTMPANGITFFFRGSVNLTQKPNWDQFWVCMVADSVWHPYSQVNIFQNMAAANKYPGSFFIRHWDQLNIIKSKSQNTVPKNIFYFGEAVNLAPELRSADWRNFLTDNKFVFKNPHFSQWNDYSEADIVIGIRSFGPQDQHINKPASKLFNAWRANVLFIGGNDSAYSHECETEFDYIAVKNYDELKKVLVDLKTNSQLYAKYRSQAIVRGDRLSHEFFLDQWIKVINGKIIPIYKRSGTSTWLQHQAFLLNRYLIFKSESIALRLRKVLKRDTSYLLHG